MALSRCLECAEEDIAHEDMAYSLRNFHIDHIIATRLTIHFRDDPFSYFLPPNQH